MEKNDNQLLFSQLDQLLAKTNLADVTAENQFSELKDGFYLSELTEASIKVSKSSGKLQAELIFKVAEDGVDMNVDIKGNTILKKIEKSKNRTFRLYYGLSDETSIKRFVSDMLKFEGEKEGVPILDKSVFTSVENLESALEVIEGVYIYVQVSTTEKDGKSSTWKNIISWKRAKDLELPL